MDNSAIARIASPDLTNDTLALLDAHGANDDVVFFLGRLVWQGDMTGCASALAEIASNPSRGRYARIAAIRGVMAVGGSDQKDSLWEAIATDSSQLDHAVLAELVDSASPTMRSVEVLLRTLEHAQPFDRYDTSGLDRALHRFVAQLPVMADEADNHPLGRLVDGLNEFLGREPFVERGECHVSKNFAWLMPPAIHAVDRLVAARSACALMPAAIAILRNIPALRFWRSNDFDEYKNALANNIPRWRGLNDLLYWESIAKARARLESKDPKEQMLDDWQISYMGHFWRFGAEDFERCLEWIRTKQGDDRSVALFRCVNLYIESDRPAAWLAQLRAAVADDAHLYAMLEARLNFKPPLAAVERDAEFERLKRQHKRRERREKKDRADWVLALRANPDRVLHPAGLKPGDFSHDQYHLLTTCMTSSHSNTREEGANWQSLIPEFGESVARAYRDAAVAHWRIYEPPLRSEGAGAGSTPYSLLFAMTGLAIEFAEDSAFAQRLTSDEARIAFRYITWQLNGFPAWFERLYRAFPQIGSQAVAKELVWELQHSEAKDPTSYILHDILYHAPWLHAEVASVIFDWLQINDMPNTDGLRYCLNILTGGGVTPGNLATLAAKKIKNTAFPKQRPRWFALWVDADASAAIPELASVLEALPTKGASDFAEQFAVGLLGDRHGTGARVASYRNAEHLKALYILMHRFIRVADDIERAGRGVYSPTLRDNAQEARNSLFNMLVEVPGVDAYAAIKALELDHPESEYRRWMGERARARATMDGDEPAWTAEQVHDFVQAIEEG